MDRKTATLLGAAAAFAAGPTLAAPPAHAPAVPVAGSYAELLTPIPNAVERLKVSDAEWDARQPQLIKAQYAGPVDHHHHHHHHQQNRHSRRWYLAHGYVWSNGGWILRPRHHHHHHHHSNY
jgi:hypothetical protein